MEQAIGINIMSLDSERYKYVTLIMSKCMMVLCRLGLLEWFVGSFLEMVDIPQNRWVEGMDHSDCFVPVLLVKSDSQKVVGWQNLGLQTQVGRLGYMVGMLGSSLVLGPKQHVLTLLRNMCCNCCTTLL